MKKHETLSKGEELLAHVLEECLEEDLSFVPPEREIARSHWFSERFEEAMKMLLERSTGHHREKEIQKHFSPRYGQWVACILVFCVCSGLFYYVIGPSMDKGAAESTATTEAEATDVVEESAAEEAPAASEEGAPAEGSAATEEEAAAEELLEAESGSATGQLTELKATITYCGQIATLAEHQEVPETLDYVTTLVNCPVLDEENPVLYLTIGNIGEEDIQYLSHYDLEVWIDGGWYVIPDKSQSQGEWMTLEAGMAIDEEIDLSDYQVDYDAQQYRLITYVGQDLISAEFTFNEVFTETMEELEEEVSSGE